MIHTKRFCIAVLLLFAITNVMAGKDGYNIKVKVVGLKDTVCYLANHYGDKQYLKDTVKVNTGGELVFKGKDSLPGGIYMVVLPNHKYFEFIVTGQNFSLETDTLDFVKHMKVKGSSENSLFYQYLNFIAAKSSEIEPYRDAMKKLKEPKDSDSVAFYRKKINGIDKEVKEYKLKFIAEHPETFLSKVFKASADPDVPASPLLPNGKKDSTFEFRYFKEHYLDGVDFSDNRLLRTPIIHNKIKYYLDNLTIQIPDSINLSADYLVKKAKANKEVFKYVVYYITYTYETSSIMCFDAVFVHMVENYYTDGQAYWVDSTQLYKIIDRARTLKPLLCNKVAPNLVMADTNGVYHSLHNVPAKITILCFWDPDCGHCKKSVPKLDSAWQNIKSKGVEVFAVCTEVEIDKWKKFIRDHHFTWINVADPEFKTGFRSLYDIHSTPQIYILNDKKEIIAKRLGAEQVEDFVNRVLEKENNKKGD